MNRLAHLAALSFLVITAGGLGFLSYQALQPKQSSSPAVKVNSMAAGFSLPDLTGKQIATSDYAGQWLLVNFWATWCPPCIEEMPLLSGLNSNNAQLTVIGVALDSAEAVNSFTEKVPVSFPLLIAESSGSEIARQWGNNAGALPFTALLNPEGKIVKRWLGPLKPKLINAELAEFIQ